MAKLIPRPLLISVMLMALTACTTPSPVATTPQEITTPAQALESIALPTGFQYPNGIARAQDGTLYVGSVTSGRIVRIDPAGKTETLFPGNDDVFAGTSLRLDEARGILWGASPDVLGTRQANGEVVRRPHRIFALDIRTGKVSRIVMMPDGGFSNDIALDPQGGVYVTDSTRPRIHYLAPGARQLRTWAEDERFRTSLRFGLSGIALRADGVVFVTMYSDGRLFRVTPGSAGQPTIEEISLPRKIDGADAIQWAADGSLIMAEGGIEGGDGRLLRLTGLETGTSPRLEILAAGMNLPVNLTIAGNQVWLTESLFRHRLVPGQEANIPDRFYVRRYRLP